MKYKDIAKECVNNYYTSLLQVVDNTIDYEYKSEAKKEIIDVFFENEDKIIGNDLQKLGFNQDTYKVGDYLTKCMSVNGNNKEKQVVVSVADLEISDMYKNKNENIYMFVITFDRILKINENIEDEKSKEKVYSDKIIMTLTTINGDDYKISQFTKLINKYDPLKDGYILVKANETTKSNQPSSSAYFICNIQPATAKLIIDDMEIDYANGEKIATTLGFHKIIIKAPKYVDKILQLNVREIGNKNIDVKLESAKGFLTLIAERSEFDGASIEIINTATNNSYNESLPIHNFELELGTYNVEIFKNGYYNKKYKNITIFPEINTTKTIKKLVSKEKVKAGVKTTIGILNGLFGK
ncbi:MAG: hypothetical protein IPP60_03700 [Sphingobacteriales bacterium]|nr:hypothetical protein [Sphingobacteriales bacterium]